MTRSSWELLISAESRVKYRPGVLTAFDTNSTLRVLPDGAWIRWKCLVAGVWPPAQCALLLKIFGQGLIFLFQIKKKFEQCWKGETFQTCRYIHWLRPRFLWMIPDSSSECRTQHLVITIPCPHDDHIDFLLLAWHWTQEASPGHCPNPHVSHINIILRTRAKNILTQKFCNFTRQKYSI